MEKVIKLLNDNTVCYIATCSDNIPRATPMEYVMVDDSLIFSTRGNTNKDKNLKENNKISVTVNNMPVFVTLNGTTETPSVDEIEKLKKVYFERHPELEEDIKGWSLCYYKVIPVVAYYTDYSQDVISEIIHA
ncbi:MAG: pyridoxamine 5'-phosphate oxidase family protein [Defluviitaleaceae bacterium]|nr:pyridoxamine 5'-phosphate oxidase family protein [Defluviitaleaceae bacterium]